MSFDEKIFGWIVKKWGHRKELRDRLQNELWARELHRLELLSEFFLKKKLCIQSNLFFEASSLETLYVVAPGKDLDFNSALQFARLKFYFHLGWVLRSQGSAHRDISLDRGMVENLPADTSDFEHEWEAVLKELQGSCPRIRIRIREIEDQLKEVERWFKLWTQWKNGDRNLKLSSFQRRLLPEIPSICRAEVLERADVLSKNHKNMKGYQTSQIELQASSKMKRIKIDTENENPLIHVFEKLLTPDNYQGGSKPMDSSDELEEHKDGLKELELNQLIRTSGSSEAGVSVDVHLENQGGPADASQGSFEYREWFHSERSYREAWCRLKEIEFSAASPRPIEPLTGDLKDLKRIIESIAHTPRALNRQPDGDDLDMDQVIRRSSGDKRIDRIFRDRVKIEKDQTLLFLIDTSSSSDSYVMNRRMIDEQLKAVQWLRVLLEEWEERIGVAGFFSETRHDCSFSWIKRFDEPWRVASERMSSVSPQGYTRMGPALRHAEFCLSNQASRRKNLILFTDAKPTDYDFYEGEHGRYDVRRALEDLSHNEIDFFALVFAKTEKREIRDLFGAHEYALTWDAEAMARGISEYLLKSLH